METHETLVSSLLTQYGEIFKRNKPDWAVHKRNPPEELVSPTIPFVGKHYAEQKTKILVYASAEVLTGYCRGEETDRPWLDEDAIAINRHRKCFDDVELQGESFFPHVHITPLNNGTLATAIMYLVQQIRGHHYEDPREFYETVAFGNYGKFSIETKYQHALRNNPEITAQERKRLKKQLEKKNVDTANNLSCLMASREYIRQDIEILEPDYIIMPRVSDQEFIEAIKGDARIIQVYQMNTGVINRHIVRKYPRYDIRDLSQTTLLWYTALHEDGMVGKSKENYLSVFSYLDEVLKNL